MTTLLNFIQLCSTTYSTVGYASIYKYNIFTCTLIINMRHMCFKIQCRKSLNLCMLRTFKHASVSYLRQFAFCLEISAGLTLNFSAVIINFSSRAETLVNNSVGRECKDRARAWSPVAFVPSSWMLLKVCYLKAHERNKLCLKTDTREL